ncbi:hypothetical protein Pfo_023903 [Paulownia fortunei]|nr:hypothetical protein Pfo_023903 [Paulownia fortunei]
MAVKMLPQNVADAFVKQYYAILNKCPENVHKFYGESSLLGWPGPDGVVTPVTTLSGINDKIMSSDYKNFSAEVKTVDAQESQDRGVIVAVTGSLTGKDNAKKNFSQTFFLAKQEKGFFVLNDILRFFDIWSITNTAANDDGIKDQPAPSTQSSVACNISDSPTSLHTKATGENGKVKEAFDLSVSKDTVAKGAASASSIASGERVHSVVAPASNVTQKMTYASMVAKETPVTSPRTARVTSNVYKQPVASPTTKASASLGDGAPKVSTPGSAASKALASSTKVAPKLPTGGSGAPNTSAYAEARGIYIGRLPYDITKQGIVDVVKKFGPVKRNSDTVQIRRHEDGFCCGFVEFESADSARRAVEAHHVSFGETEAYIAYKKSSSNRGNDGGSRSPTRGGSFRNGSFRGWENEAAHNERFQNENWTDYKKGQAKGPQRSRPSNQRPREASRDRLN